MTEENFITEDMTEDDEEALCLSSFEATLAEYELDTGLTMEEIFYEMYQAGFFTALAIQNQLENGEEPNRETFGEDIHITTDNTGTTTVTGEYDHDDGDLPPINIRET
jgi:hypothetical protein